MDVGQVVDFFENGGTMEGNKCRTRATKLPCNPSSFQWLGCEGLETNGQGGNALGTLTRGKELVHCNSPPSDYAEVSLSPLNALIRYEERSSGVGLGVLLKKHGTRNTRQDPRFAITALSDKEKGLLESENVCLGPG